MLPFRQSTVDRRSGRTHPRTLPRNIGRQGISAALQLFRPAKNKTGGGINQLRNERLTLGDCGKSWHDGKMSIRAAATDIPTSERRVIDAQTITTSIQMRMCGPEGLLCCA